MNLEDYTDHLPDIVKQIAEVIGFDATSQLVARLGGLGFLIGKGRSITGDVRRKLLIEVIGIDKTKLLLHHFGGEYIYIPRCNIALRLFRNKQFITEYYQQVNGGISGSLALIALCPKYGFSDRQAWTILGNINRNTSSQEQPNLF